jgi:uncharacterized protein YjbJ (UPF0337 family)
MPIRNTLCSRNRIALPQRTAGLLSKKSPALIFCEVIYHLPTKGGSMDWNQVKGNWNKAKGKVREKWGKLTDDEIEQIAGNRDQLVGHIQKKYGIAKEEAEKQVKDWEGGTGL